MQTQGIQLYSALAPPPEASEMLRNYTNRRVMTLLTPNFGEIASRARFSLLGVNVLFGHSAGPWVSTS